MTLSQAQVLSGLVHGHAGSAPSRNTAPLAKPPLSRPGLGLSNWRVIVVGVVCPSGPSIRPRHMLAQLRESWLAAPTHIYTLPKIGNGGNIKPNLYAFTQDSQSSHGTGRGLCGQCGRPISPSPNVLPQGLYLEHISSSRPVSQVPP